MDTDQNGELFKYEIVNTLVGSRSLLLPPVTLFAHTHNPLDYTRHRHGCTLTRS
jgi:hypothetical protein